MALFDGAIFDTGAAVLVGPRVILTNDPAYAQARSTRRGRADYYKIGSLSGRYQ